MRVVVTGGAGFVGAALVARLLSEGDDVVVVDSFGDDLYDSATKRRRLAPMLDHASLSVLELDLRDADLAPVVAGADAVVHLAAMAGLTPSWTRFPTYLSCNVLATQRLLDALVREPGAHLVHGSTSSVYGAVAVGDESLPLQPVSPYGTTKLAAEKVVAAYGEVLGVPSTVLRYFSVYGPGQRPDMAYATFCRLLLAGEPLPVTGDGTQTRSCTYVDDVVDATVRAVRQQPRAVLNVCGDDEVSVLDVVGVLSRTLGVDARLQHLPPRPGDQLRTRGDSSAAREVLGWRPQVGHEQGLAAQALASAAEPGAVLLPAAPAERR